MLKATAGGGGGMRAVWKDEDLLKAWDGARQESAAAFGNDGMYLEKLIEEPRHIEIQVIGIHTEKHVTFLKEIVLYKGVIKID
jgi:acetyl-CoA carboxylase biotin carboxylase subunit